MYEKFLVQIFLIFELFGTEKMTFQDITIYKYI